MKKFDLFLLFTQPTRFQQENKFLALSFIQNE
jgi:hypothetical protein